MGKCYALTACLVGLVIMVANIPAFAEKTKGVEHVRIPTIIGGLGTIPVDEELNEMRAKIPAFISSLREMLKKREFEKLNVLLLQYEEAYEEDVSNEVALFDAYRAFAVNDSTYEALMDEWIAAYPESHQPYLIRASYFHKQGWVSRGSKWAKDTSEEQFEGMRNYFLKAIKDIERSFEIRPGHVVSYSLLINVYKSLGRPEDVGRIVDKALSEAPSSFEVRSSYLLAITPRWGGSYEEMDQFSDEALIHLSKNPRLMTLKGYAYYDAGRIQMSAKNYGVAKDLFDVALSFGDLAMFYNARARAFEKLKESDDALKDINQAIEMNPHVADYYFRRARIMSGKKMLRESLINIEISDQLSPNDKDTIKYIKWLAERFIYTGYEKRKTKNFEGALDDYNLAIRANPVGGSSYYRRAQVLIDKKDLGSAYRDLEKSIQLDPNNFDAYHLMDWVLVQSSRWDEIIKYWDKYIALNPESDKAYLERGGAHFRKRDIVAAVADAKKAADLGNVEGQKTYDRYKHMVN